MQDGSFDDPGFLEQLRRGDEGAYRRLIRRYHGSLVGVASGIVGSRAQAEEVVQDTWLAVFSAIARFEGRSSLASWLFTITLNRARTRVVREGRMVPFSSFGEGAEGEEHAVDPARIIGGRQLWAVVQAVIVMRDIEAVEAEQVCALLEISPENQRVLLHRARGRVRAAIEQTLRGEAGKAGAASKPAAARPGPLRRMMSLATEVVAYGRVVAFLPGYLPHQRG